MKSGQTMFFATLNDMAPIVNEVENLIDIRYYLTGLLDSSNIPAYKSILDAPNIGYMAYADWNWADDYIILPDKLLLNVRNVPQIKGGIKYAVDQLRNQQSITIKLGGIYTGASNVLVAGRVATISEEAFSLELFQMFSTRIRKQFKKKLEGFYIGPEAQEMLRDGWRLVTIGGLDKSFDIKWK